MVARSEAHNRSVAARSVAPAPPRPPAAGRRLAQEHCHDRPGRLPPWASRHVDFRVPPHRRPGHPACGVTDRLQPQRRHPVAAAAGQDARAVPRADHHSGSLDLTTHRPGSLPRLAPYLHERTAGRIGSPSRLTARPPSRPSSTAKNASPRPCWTPSRWTTSPRSTTGPAPPPAGPGPAAGDRPHRQPPGARNRHPVAHHARRAARAAASPGVSSLLPHPPRRDLPARRRPSPRRTRHHHHRYPRPRPPPNSTSATKPYAARPPSPASCPRTSPAHCPTGPYCAAIGTAHAATPAGNPSQGSRPFTGQRAAPEAAVMHMPETSGRLLSGVVVCVQNSARPSLLVSVITGRGWAGRSSRRSGPAAAATAGAVSASQMPNRLTASL